MVRAVRPFGSAHFIILLDRAVFPRHYMRMLFAWHFSVVLNFLNALEYKLSTGMIVTEIHIFTERLVIYCHYLLLDLDIHASLILKYSVWP